MRINCTQIFQIIMPIKLPVISSKQHSRTRFQSVFQPMPGVYCDAMRYAFFSGTTISHIQYRIYTFIHISVKPNISSRSNHPPSRFAFFTAKSINTYIYIHMYRYLYIFYCYTYRQPIESKL